MKKIYVYGLFFILVIILLSSFYFYFPKNSKNEFNTTILELGFEVPEDYSMASAKLLCEDIVCIENYPVSFFENCKLIWNESNQESSAVGKPVYESIGIFDCGKGQYVQWSKSPPARIKIAEISN